MRILVTNDDGIDAPGLKALESIARELSDDVWVVAPEANRSGAGHSVTLTEPLRLREVGERRFSVKGTPTDCVILSVRHLMDDKQPDLVLSGINQGQNMADDVTYSGTIACAMEGVLLGIPSVALSLACTRPRPAEFRWETAVAHGTGLLRKLLAQGWSKDIILNINFPDCETDDVKGVKITRQGQRHPNHLKIDERVDTHGAPYYWIEYGRLPVDPENGTDLSAVYGGFISITPLHLDLTHDESVTALEVELGDALDGGLKRAG